MECTYRIIQDCSVELGDNISTSSVVRDDDHWAKIALVHFPIQGLLESGVSDQHEASRCEVIVLDLHSMFS